MKYKKPKILVSKEGLIGLINYAHDMGMIFTPQERDFLVWLIENFEKMDKDAKRWKVFKRAIVKEDKRLIEEVEAILDEEIKQV